MRHLTALLLSLFLFLSPSAWSQEAEPTAAQVVAAVEQAYRGVNSLKADFVQVTRSPAMGEESRQKGKVQLKRPRKMRWQFTQPTNSVFVTDGQRMWVYSAADNQVIVTEDLSAAAGNDMTQLLDDLSKLGQLFDVQKIDEASTSGATGGEKRSYTLDLKPKKQANFKKLRIVVSRKDYTLERVEMTDPFDNVVELSFSQVRVNPEISDSEFVFQVPAGAQVINTSGM